MIRLLKFIWMLVAVGGTAYSIHYLHTTMGWEYTPQVIAVGTIAFLGGRFS